MLSIYLLILRPNILSLLIGWDGLGLRSYLLVIYYGNRKAYNSGFITAIRNRVGDILILFRIRIFLMIGNWDLIILRIEKNFYLLSILICVAACTKRAQIPFSAWLPAAIAAPTPVSALVHSSTLVTAGVYLMIRFYNFLFINNRLNYLLWIGIITTLMARLAAFLENDIKKIVALSTLSQLGIIIISLGLHSYLLRFFHLIAHAFFKALLFISTGNIIHMNRDYQDLRVVGAIEYQSSINRKFVLISNFRLIGLPFIARFFRKERIIELIILSHNYFYVYVILLISVLRTSIYRTRFILSYYIRSFHKISLMWVKDEDYKIISRIILLLLPAALGGWWLRDLLIDFCAVSRNSTFFLVIVLIILIIGVILGYYFRILHSLFNYSVLLFRIVRIWNLTLISRKNFIVWILNTENRIKKVEIGIINFSQTQFLFLKIFSLKVFNEISSLVLYLLIFRTSWLVILRLVY